MTQFVSPFGRRQPPTPKSPSGRLDVPMPAFAQPSPQQPGQPGDTAKGGVIGNQGAVPEWGDAAGVEAIAMPGQASETDMVYVRRLYKELLQRDPDPEGFAQQVLALSKGTSRDQIRANFLSSPEYTALKSGEAPQGASAVQAGRTGAGVASPAPQGIGAVPLEGYDSGKLNNPGHRTPKYMFGRVASHHSLQAVKNHAQAEALLNQMLPEMKAAGLQVLAVKGDKIQVVTELGAEWVDVVRGAASGNAGWWWGSDGKVSPAPGSPGSAPAAPVAGPWAPAPQAPAAPKPAGPVLPSGPLNVDELALANYSGIQPTRESLNHLMDEMGAIHTQNAIGPGVNQPKYTAELQGWLKKWGYNVDQNGVFDAKTSAAVMQLKRDEGKPYSLWLAPDGSHGVHPYIDEAMKAVIVDKYEKELGLPAAGHWDALGIFRPSQLIKDALAQVHAWVYDQPFRDGDYSPASDQRYKEAKQATGRYKLVPRFDGMLVPIPKKP